MFEEKNKLSSAGLNILKQRYFAKGETTWEQLTDRVVDFVLSDCKDKQQKELTRELIGNRYFLPNSPCLVNAGRNKTGLLACFVVDFPDTTEGIIKTKGDFFYIARKGGGCGTTLSKLRPEGSKVNGSTHGYAGGPIKFADTISHDMDAITQSGFRSMAIMFTMSIYHPDIVKFITAKEVEGKISNANISVVVDNKFMEAVQNDLEHTTFFINKDGEKEIGTTYKARELFNMIIEGAWRNGEPGLLFYDRINDSPYKYSEQEILATNPCLVGDTLIQTVEGGQKIKDLVGKEIDVYCQIDENILGISKAYNIRKTRRDANLVRIATTRGDLICTPEHLIYTKNRGYVKAEELTRKDNLPALNKKIAGWTYSAISLTGTNPYIKEHRFVAGHYQDISGKVVHHKDGDPFNNRLSNLEVMSTTDHSSIENLGHPDWCKHDSKGRFIKKDIKKKPVSSKLDYYPCGINIKILKVENLPYTEDVYDMEVETYHNFLANNIIVHNCSEQPLPPNGCCNLGSLDVSKFLDKSGILDLYKLESAIRLGVNFLNQVILKTEYPTEEIREWSMNNMPIGFGIMGFADYLLQKEIAYGSDESLQEMEFIMKFIYEICNDESIILGEKFGIPTNNLKLPVQRRNVTLTTIAPTGTTHSLAGCSSGIEPYFSEIVRRVDKTGEYKLVSKLADKPYFRCAVAANGATEVTWMEHLQMLNSAQRFVDSGVSKTINCPTHTHRDTVYDIFMTAWKLPYIKGLTIYRSMSRKEEVLTPQQLKKDHCPLCKSELEKIDNIRKCTSKDCNFSIKDST